MKKNVLLIYGGGSSEHEISKISASYLKSQINKDNNNLIEVEISENFEWLQGEHRVELNFNKEIVYLDGKKIQVDYIIPCIHGYPGETGDLQAFLDMIKIPYLGNDAQANNVCFNKILTKLWLDKLGVPTTDFIALSSFNESAIENVKTFLKKYGKVFIKASTQGSSVGCFPLSDESEIFDTLKQAFNYSNFVLVEKNIVARELEVSAFEYKGKLHISEPGEIVCPDSFYSFEQKYDKSSKATTEILAQNLKASDVQKIKDYTLIAFESLKLKDLSRVDFFYTNEGEILLNEINTFPGLTPISMFPQMMENYGVSFKEYIEDRINSSL